MSADSSRDRQQLLIDTRRPTHDCKQALPKDLAGTFSDNVVVFGHAMNQTNTEATTNAREVSVEHADSSLLPQAHSDKAISMAHQLISRRNGSYGIDAPIAPIFLSAVAVIALIMAIISRRWLTLVPVIFILSVLGIYLHTTLRGKFAVWADLLSQIEIRGNERILDMGCGRGAVLLMAAQRLTTGIAVGVDLWRSVDQSGNSLEATRQNAVAEGVADRIELHTGDMSALPFDDNSFDVVVSSLAIHNISGRHGRSKAIQEAVRVLRPGGRMMIADIRGTGQYQDQLGKLGMNDISCRGLGWRFWWGGPWGATRLVTASKPSLPHRDEHGRQLM